MSVSSSFSSVDERPHLAKNINYLHRNALNNRTKSTLDALKNQNKDNNELSEDGQRLITINGKKFKVVPANDGNAPLNNSNKNNLTTETARSDSERSRRSNGSSSNTNGDDEGITLIFNSPRNRRDLAPPAKQYLSMRSLKQPDDLTLSGVCSPSTSSSMVRTGSAIFSDCGSQFSHKFNDAMSVRSLASIGMGSTDGRKMVIRRVPTSPNELLNLVNPPTPPEERSLDGDGYDDMSDDGHGMKPRHQHWANKMQFVLACVGYSVGLGNVWRFPYLCYQSGGGVFLIPYFIILVVCGIPMLFMELAIGQYTGRGPIGALGQICPLFKGAGLASVVISFCMSTYYCVIIAYAIYYFFASFKPEMPWSDCSNRWNTPDCWNSDQLRHNISRPALSRTPSEEFFEQKVLKVSQGIQFPGDLRWELVACLICAWMLVYFAIWKSIKSSAKVRYFTTTLPFILIVIFLGRSLTLDGADKGLRYFFKPNWALLGDAKVWINAVAQNFNSIGIAFGSMISFASYNKFHNNFLQDTLAVSFVNAITSLLVGIFTFATIGNIALEQNMDVEAVISDGPGLIFVVYPQAIAKMPASQLWAVLFFFMLLCLGLNSQFAIVEVVVTSIQDGFPNWIRRNLVYHEMLVLIICVVSFLFGLPNILQSGIYYFQLIDHYAASISITYLAFFEIIAITWFYGEKRLSRNVKQMTGKAPSLYFRMCWLIAAPLLLFAVWVFSLIDYHPPTYHNGNYHYPGWAEGLGWTIASISLFCIPGYAAVTITRAEGDTFMEKFKNSIKPTIFECKICEDHNCDHFDEDSTAGNVIQEMSPMLGTATFVIPTPSTLMPTTPHPIIPNSP